MAKAAAASSKWGRRTKKRATPPRRSTTRSTTRVADSKGRITMGEAYKNRHFIIEPISSTEFIVKLARVVPESEAWLYENPEALAAVAAGLREAREGEVGPGPDLAVDEKLVKALED